ncbi:gliding motility-associated C-terminal domain-containing protein [Adhaeribacter terreus]|uniref:Gliding motility-associated C-terminal domain-containing protein n=1 Tax=Adhaeribacter terreus TaxID=529703 RepID=A0ABW0E9X0_9BACT
MVQPSQVLSHTFSIVNKPVVVKQIPSVTNTLCSRVAPVKIDIGRDSILCANAPLALRDRSGTALASYIWSTGDTTATIAVTQPGKYWLRATTSCNGQTLSDTVTVTRINFPKPALTQDTALCQNSEVLINATLPGAVYRWQDGSTNAIFRATKPGTYEVDVTYQTCPQRFSVKIGDYENLLLPNIFTPNNDSRNDTFRPMQMCGIASGTLKIYNRWGQLLYETSDIGKGWNGRVNGGKSADGVYFYLVEYRDFNGQLKRKKGWVELVGG